MMKIQAILFLVLCVVALTMAQEEQGRVANEAEDAPQHVRRGLTYDWHWDYKYGGGKGNSKGGGKMGSSSSKGKGGGKMGSSSKGKGKGGGKMGSSSKGKGKGGGKMGSRI